MDFHINYLAVLAAGLADMFIGALWYSPLLLGNIWMKAYGKTKKEMQAQMKEGNMAMIASSLAALVTAFVMAHILQYTHAVDLMSGAITGFWLWLGFLAAGILPAYVFEQRKPLLYVIFVGYKFATFIVMALILTYWM